MESKESSYNSPKRYIAGDDIADDDARGIYTLRYTSSSTWPISIPTNMPNDIASARIVAAQRAAQGDRRAQAWKDCQFLNEKGEPACKFFNVHWLRGVSWFRGLSPLPSDEQGWTMMHNAGQWCTIRPTRLEGD